MKEKITQVLAILGILLICCIICFGVGYNQGKKSIEPQQDTVVIEKVVTNYKPIPIEQKDLYAQKIKIPTYLIFTEYKDSSKHKVLDLQYSLDSLKCFADSLEIELQRVQKHYVDSCYEAWVSGIDPQLDSIKVKQQVKYITNTIINEKDKFQLNIGLNADGWKERSVFINPNVNVSYNIKRVTLSGEFGVQIPYNNTSGTLPYIQFGINYSLWSF